MEDQNGTVNIEEGNLGNLPSLIKQLEESLADSRSVAADIAGGGYDTLPDWMKVFGVEDAWPEDNDDIAERPSPSTSDHYLEDEGSYMNSLCDAHLDMELNLGVEDPVNLDPIEDYYDK
ncbi:hypothetical protein C0989_004046, partial [Termitomyces sp. Mn162]